MPLFQMWSTPARQLMRVLMRVGMLGGTVAAMSACAPAGTVQSRRGPTDPPARPGAAAPVFLNGQAQIVPAFQDTAQWIRQELWVETRVDSDHDGVMDRVHVDVTRQRQTETDGLRVATIYESSPYFAGTAGDLGTFWNVEHPLGITPPPRVPQPELPFAPVRPRIARSEVNTWVPRGFAVVHSEALGTGLSTGCPTVGDAPEQLAPKAVIDWLNGRATGYTSVQGGTRVSAAWATGKVGMIGTSYNGTIPLAAAVTGVDGLAAIIPIAPNTSYYHYYRSNGLVRSPGGYLGEDVDVLYDFIHTGAPAARARCNAQYRDGLFAAQFDRVHGDYNAFWASRDLLTKIRGVKAATLLAHGLNDYNVVPEHSMRIYEALKAQGTPTQLYLHQGGHGGPPPLDMQNKWFSHYLYGVSNGVERDPRLFVMREGAPRGSMPTPYADYPNPLAAAVTVYPQGNGAQVGGLALRAVSTGRDSLIDEVRFSGSALAAVAASPHRLLYATPVLQAPVHLSGTTTITVRLASSAPAANLSVWLVQLPYDSARTGSEGHAGVITRGWADPQNHASLTQGGNFASMRPGTPLVPGQFVSLTFDLQPDDQIIPAGKQLGVLVMSSDREFTLWPPAGTRLTLDLAATRLALPVVGGVAAWQRATGTP